MKQFLIIPVLIASAAIAIAGILGNFVSRQQIIKDECTIDNNSFSIGVWCIEQALKHGVPFKTNEFYKDGWTVPSGINHREILHAARHNAVTNGWPRFNNRDGFSGDE